MPEVHIKELEQSGEVRKTLMIHSPAKGVIIHKTALEGQFVKPGENLYRIADLSKVWVYADIYEYELPWVESGQSADMTLSYLPGKTFKGKITYVYPYLESKTRTAKIRLEFDNPALELKPDMYADVKINTAPMKEVIAIPKESVIHSGERKVIIIDKGKGLFEPRDILIGMETKDYYELLHGAKPGESIVTSAQFLIDSESQLNEAINKMLKAKRAASSEEIPEHQGHEGMKMAQQVSDNTKSAMKDIWKAYFYLRKNLAEDSLARFEVQAELIKDRANTIIMSNEDKKIKSIAEKFLESSDGLKEKDIVKVRDAFLKLSDSMIHYMKHFSKEESVSQGYKLFFCGMEKKSWVQTEEEVGNPYVGSKIAFCGARDEY